MPTATPCCSLRQRNLPTDSRYPTVNQHSLSRIVVEPNVAVASIMNVNSRDCPGLAITTLEGRKVGIYAQDGLGFILYDYSAQRRLGICSFD